MKITKDMTMGYIVQEFPATVPVFENKGMSCLSCPTANLESLEKGAALHGIDLDEILAELNAVINQ